MILDQFGREPIAEKQVEKARNLKEIVTSPNMPTSCYIQLRPGFDFEGP